jgi:hypothetical protein
MLLLLLLLLLLLPLLLPALLPSVLLLLLLLLLLLTNECHTPITILLHIKAFARTTLQLIHHNSFEVTVAMMSSNTGDVPLQCSCWPAQCLMML